MCRRPSPRCSRAGSSARPLRPRPGRRAGRSAGRSPGGRSCGFLLVGRPGLSVAGPSPSGSPSPVSCGARRALRTRRNRRTPIAPNSRAQPMPRNSQITLLTWADRMVRPVVAPSGVPRLSVTTRVTSWMPFSSVRAVSSTETRRLAGTSILAGLSMVSRSSARAPIVTVTGWSSSLLTVAWNHPLELESVTARGASTCTRASRSAIHTWEPSATRGSRWAGCGRSTTRCRGPRRSTLTETTLLRVSRFWRATPLWISSSPTVKFGGSSSATSCHFG